MTTGRAINPDARVHPDLPAGAAESPYSGLLDGLREARAGHRAFHHCPECGGWVEGVPGHARVNTMTPLAGRNGSAYSCRRCGAELAFVGSVS